MSSTKKLLVVFGATGNQGGSVIRSILSDEVAKQQFAIRAITRDTTKPSATALAEQGVEVFKADLEDKESLRAALKDAYAVFAVTNFQENYDAESETRQGKNVADVAKERNVQHLVWSSLPHVSKITNNTITKVVHFDSKGLVDDYFRDIGVPSTMLHLAIFNQFIVSSLASMPTNPPTYKLFFPHPAKASTLIPLIDPVADTGKYVKAILLSPDKTIGKTINAAENFYSMDEVVATFKRVGIDVAFEVVDEATFRVAMTAKGVPEFFQDDTLENVKYISMYGYFGGGTLEEGHQLLTEPLNSLEHFLKNSDALVALKG